MDTQTQNPPTKQTPMDESLERIAEAAPVMMLPRVIMAQAMKGQQDSHAKRVADSHRAMAEAAGMSEALEGGEGDEMGGDINICGDITIASEPAKAEPKPEPPALPEPTKATATDEKTPNRYGKAIGAATKMAAGAGLLGTGLAIGSMLGGGGDEQSPTQPAATAPYDLDIGNVRPID